MTGEVPDNVIYIEDWLERGTKPVPLNVRRRLAEIAMEKLLLQSEENHLKSLLDKEK